VVPVTIIWSPGIPSNKKISLFLDSQQSTKYLIKGIGGVLVGVGVIVCVAVGVNPTVTDGVGVIVGVGV
jgi:hypothetical protein